jgi:thioredoxin-dependent peroxiredoxin
MKRVLMSACVTAALLAAPAYAMLNVGAKAPDFKARASIGGKQFDFSLTDALKKGPVVLYFYPAAFTPGCTLEANNFAEAMDDFAKLGATVIGVSHDDIATLDRFSLTECRSKFPVASDADARIMRSYDAMVGPNATYASRTSYVISPAGQIVYSYTNPDYSDHTANTMNAVKKLVGQGK